MQKQGGLFSVKSTTPPHYWILAAPSSTNRRIGKIQRIIWAVFRKDGDWNINIHKEHTSPFRGI